MFDWLGFVEIDKRGVIEHFFYFYKIRLTNIWLLGKWLVQIFFWAPVKLMTIKSGAVVTMVIIFASVHIFVCNLFNWVSGADFWLSFSVVCLVAVWVGRIVYPFIQKIKLEVEEIPKLVQLEPTPC